jgi:hypothetical protein
MSPPGLLRAFVWLVACGLPLAATVGLAPGCIEQVDSGAASGSGAEDGGGGATDAEGLSAWQLCQSPSCDWISGEIPYLDQTPPIFLPDGATTASPCDDVEQASMAVRQTYCASCHQAPADQAGINFTLDDAQLAVAQSQTAVTDAGVPQKLIVPGDPLHSWYYVRVAQGMGGGQGGMPPLAMPGYPTIPRPSASDLSVLYAWIVACFPGTDAGAYALGGGNYAPSTDAGADLADSGDEGDAGNDGP